MVSKKFILALFCSVGVALPFAAGAQLPTTPASGGGTSAPSGGGMSAPASGGGMSAPASGGGMSAPGSGGMSAPASQDLTTPPSGGTSSPAPDSMTKPPKMSPKPKGTTSTTPVSVNSATPAQLIKVKGIGPATAKKIVANRPYASLDDLVTKKVFTQKQFTQLKSQLGL
jgi:Helix-hairpin-helix motif